MRRHTKMKTVIQCLLVTAYLGSLGACTDAYAADTAPDQGQEIARRVVKFADLDLTHTAGAAALYSRIQSAARQVCTPTFASWEWATINTTRPCITKAITHAVADVNAPMLTSFHIAKTQQSIRLAEKQ